MSAQPAAHRFSGATGLTTDAASIAGHKPELRASWLPMIVIGLAQILMSFNINALRVSVGGIVASFNTSPTTVGTAIVIHSLVVAGLVMLGAKIGTRFGARSVFQAMVVLFGVAMAIMAQSPNPTMMIAAQAVAGATSAALIPTLVVLIAANYRGRQQAQAPGWLGASEAMGAGNPARLYALQPAPASRPAGWTSSVSRRPAWVGPSDGGGSVVRGIQFSRHTRFVTRLLPTEAR